MIKNKNLKKYIQKAVLGAAGTILGFGVIINVEVEEVEANTFSQATFYSEDPSTFIENIGPAASSIAEEHGLYASVMIAQAILESDYGRSQLASPPTHNLFGIKGNYDGNSILLPTIEFLDGEFVTIDDEFRSYPGYYSSLLNNASFIRNGNAWDAKHYKGAWVENTESYHDATAWLENRYATDPNYASKLNELIERYQLTKFDAAVSTLSNREVEAVDQPVEEATNVSTHLVTTGDTMYNISNRYGMSVSKLQSLNKKTTHNIQIGEALSVVEGKGHAVRDEEERHVVHLGDTLFNVATRYGMTVSELKQMNQLKTNFIQEGESLHIKNTTATTERKHIVEEGDTIYNIAARYDVSVDALKNLNQLQGNHITIGQEIWY